MSKQVKITVSIIVAIVVVAAVVLIGKNIYINANPKRKLEHALVGKYVKEKTKYMYGKYDVGDGMVQWSYFDKDGNHYWVNTKEQLKQITSKNAASTSWKPTEWKISKDGSEIIFTDTLDAYTGKKNKQYKYTDVTFNGKKITAMFNAGEPGKPEVYKMTLIPENK